MKRFIAVLTGFLVLILLTTRGGALERQKATFAGGCFWGIEKYFGEEPGVVETRVGYTGGKIAHPGYELVCTGNTGHAEAVEVVYDPSKTTYGKLLAFFFAHHDPTTLNRQANDVGTQYRSAIFYHTPQQKKAAENAIHAIGALGIYRDPIVTEVVPAGEFYAAENYHQKYLKKNPGGYCSIRPLSRKEADRLRSALSPDPDPVQKT